MHIPVTTQFISQAKDIVNFTVDCNESCIMIQPIGAFICVLTVYYIVSIFSKETTFFVETFNMFQQFLCHCQLEYYTKYKVNFRLIVLGCTAAEVQSEFYYCSTKNSLIGLGPKYGLMPGSLGAGCGR